MTGGLKVTQTSRRGLEAVNGKLAAQVEYLRALLAQRLGPDHAFLLSEPVPLGQRAETAWFVEDGERIAPLANLPEPEAQAARARVAQLVSDIRQLADRVERDGDAGRELARALRDALVVPDGDRVWVVDGKPTLVDWGWKPAHEGSVAADILDVIAPRVEVGPARNRRTQPPASPIPATKPVPAGLVAVGGAPAAGAARRFPWLAALLWLLFAILLIVAAAVLLRSCAIGSQNWPAFIRSWLPDRCPAPTASQGSAELGRVQASVRALERDVAAREAACGVSCPASSTAPAREVPPVAPPQTAPAEIERRLEREGSTRGRYLEVTLAWNSRQDLDLAVICPNRQEISHQQLQACGGRLVTDLNAQSSALIDTPVEHIVWDETPTPNGTYTVQVTYFSAHADTAPAVPFTVIVRREGTVIAERQGTASTRGQKVAPLTFSIPLAR